jgi:hypothetical protein
MPRLFATMPTPPVYQPQAIKYLMQTIGEEVELHPIYQRDIKWTQEIMCDLIATVMRNGLIPGILLYALQAGDERVKETYRAECVDGQHRFFTLLHFFNSKAVVLPDKKPFLIYWPSVDEGRQVCVFYKRTAETEAWEAEHNGVRVDYMTAAEQNHFNNFKLDVKEITAPMSLDARRQEFLSLQKGVSVRGSDLYKNKTEVPLVKFISEVKRWEVPVKALMAAHLSMKPKNYWLNWLVRCYLIQQADDEDERAEAYMEKDSAINQMMKNNHPRLKSTPEKEARFDESITRFFGFLHGLAAGVKLTPTQFYAVYTYLLDADEGREAILVSHMKGWSTEGMSKKQRGMWENRGFEDEERKEWFERSLDELDRILVPAEEVGARKKIPKKLRERVWAKAFGDEEVGACVVCDDAIAVDNWECAHIIAHKCGGPDKEENLCPTCRTCNRSMGTDNLEVYRERYHSKKAKAK